MAKIVQRSMIMLVSFAACSLGLVACAGGFSNGGYTLKEPELKLPSCALESIPVEELPTSTPVDCDFEGTEIILPAKYKALELFGDQPDIFRVQQFGNTYSAEVGGYQGAPSPIAVGILNLGVEGTVVWLKLDGRAEAIWGTPEASTLRASLANIPDQTAKTVRMPS